jgi:isopenicillin-N epimerase
MSSASPFADRFTLDPSIHYLNHGSFGACPRDILEAQSALRAELERRPAEFMIARLPGLLAEVRSALGRFAGADPEGFAFVRNATIGVNAVARSWDLRPGDEILTTDHSYGACRKALEFIAPRRGARLVVAPVPFPIDGPDAVVDAVLAAVTPRTRLALLDHVTSPTALVFPVDRLVPALRERGVESIVDGAHALGMLPLALDRLGAAAYTANAHKWLCAPKGAAILHVRADLRTRIRPLVISHGYESGASGAHGVAGEGATGTVRFREEWDWTGTDDPTSWLAIPACLRWLEALLPGGWPALMEHNHALALRGRAILLETLGLAEPCPASMIGSIATVPLSSAAPGSPVERLEPEALTAWARARGVEPVFFHWPGPAGRLVRVSAQAYNHEDQYRALAAILPEALRAG